MRYEKLDHDYNDDDKFSKKTPKANPRNARPQSFTFTPQVPLAQPYAQPRTIFI